MAKTVKGARFVLKRTDIPGSSPTVPPNNDHTMGWIDTDIYEGELFLNVYDDKMWFRDTNDNMIELVPLNSGGTIDISYLPGNYSGAMVYQGIWDASTGNPPNTTPEKGDYWIVSVSGNTDLDGITDWQIGDFAIYNGATWDKIDNSEPEIQAVNVIYSHSYYTGMTNVSLALDFLLDNYNTYSGGTNISITDGGSGHDKTISVSDSPTFSGALSAVGLTSTSGLSVTSGGANINGTLNMTGTGTISTPGSITATNNNIETTGSGNMSANIVQVRSGRLNFSPTTNYIQSNGTGTYFYTASSLLMHLGTALTTSYNKLTYNAPKVITSNQDIVDKGFVDSTIAIHSVGLWTSGGTLLNDPNKYIAWDSIDTKYVGINVQNPVYNLHVNGSTYITGTTTIEGTLTMTGTANISTTTLSVGGVSTLTGTVNTTGAVNVGTNLSISGSITSTVNTTGAVNVGTNLDVTGNYTSTNGDILLTNGDISLTNGDISAETSNFSISNDQPRIPWNEGTAFLPWGAKNINTYGNTMLSISNEDTTQHGPTSTTTTSTTNTFPTGTAYTTTIKSWSDYASLSKINLTDKAGTSYGTTILSNFVSAYDEKNINKYHLYLTGPASTVTSWTTTTTQHETPVERHGFSISIGNNNTSTYSVNPALSLDHLNMVIWHQGASSDRDFKFDRVTGNGYADGSWTSPAADYAEMMEWEDGNTGQTDRIGYTVFVNNNGKIEIANENTSIDRIIGVTSARPTIIGNNAWDYWNEKYVKDDLGRFLKEQVELVKWSIKSDLISYKVTNIPLNITIPDDAIYETIGDEKHVKWYNNIKEFEYVVGRVPSGVTIPDDAIYTDTENGFPIIRKIINPNFNESKIYIPREYRSEWVPVGMVGILRIKKDQIIKSNWIKIKSISDMVDEYLIK